MQHKTLALSVAALALVCSVTVRAQSPDAPLGELFPSEADARGVAVQAGNGMMVSNGSQLNAGKSPALLRLVRGGQVRLCPQSGLGVNSVPGTQGLLLSMNTGAVVVNYALREYADTLVTPDFRILLAGPGTFHFALGVTNKGDTCIKPMPGNTSRLIVSETFGTGTYQLKEDEAVLFPGGRLDGRTAIASECGCAAAIPVERAAAEAPRPPAPLPGPGDPGIPSSGEPAKPAPVRVTVDTPFVFSARGSAEPYSVSRVQFSNLPNVFLLQEKVKPSVLIETPPEVSVRAPEAAPTQQEKKDKKEKKEKKGFFGRMKGMLSGLFH
jgi:hypothetical protein